MGIIRSLRTPREEMLPIGLTIDGTTSWDDYKEYDVEQSRRFELALGRMKLCSFLLGFFNPFEPPQKECLGYKWCVHKEWNEHFSKYL